MNAVYFDITELLSTSGLGLTVGLDLFGGAWGRYDSQILVLDGVGTPTLQKNNYASVNVQLLARGNRDESPNDVYTRLFTVVSYLLTLPGRTTINGVDYLGFEMASELLALGKDEEQRFVWSTNLNTYRDGYR